MAGIRSNGKKRMLGSVRDATGEVRHGRQEIADVFAAFYEKLYTGGGYAGRGGSGERGGGREVVPVSADEAEAHLRRMGKRKAADCNGVVAEMRKQGGRELSAIIAEVFSDVLAGGKGPQYWEEARLKVLFKGRDAQSVRTCRDAHTSCLPPVHRLHSSCSPPANLPANVPCMHAMCTPCACHAHAIMCTS